MGPAAAATGAAATGMVVSGAAPTRDLGPDGEREARVGEAALLLAFAFDADLDAILDLDFDLDFGLDLDLALDLDFDALATRSSTKRVYYCAFNTRDCRGDLSIGHGS